jgi:hypothetical protein
LKEREYKLDKKMIETRLEEVLKERRDAQVKNIKKNITSYIDFLRKIEKELISDLDIALAYKRMELLESETMESLIARRDHYIDSI